MSLQEKVEKTKKDNDIKELMGNKRIYDKYYLWRWKIKRFLIEEKIVEKSLNWKTVLDIFNPLIIEIFKNDKISRLELKERLIELRSNLVEHHTKYLEIHGIDESIWMTVCEHRSLHNRLRREEKCEIPEELAKISVTAANRAEKKKDEYKKYYSTHLTKRLEYVSKWMKKLKNNWIIFTESMGHSIRLYETIVYYDKTDKITVSSGFMGGRKKIHYILIDNNI